MKKLTISVILILIGILIHSQPAKDKLIPVTTSSKAALLSYTKAMKYYDEVNLDKALQAFKEALDQDKDFFMANYQLAFYCLMNQAPRDFEDFADAAINCKAKLSDGEELLKSALIRLKQGKKTLTDLGKKLVEMYPNDPNSYSNLIYFQSIEGDTADMVETLREAIKVSANPATFYNQLGYAYLTLKESDKAEEAFDKYIELEPDNPNVYDSKGDYYMYMKQYDKAYVTYMKAYSMDPSFSHDKAEIAKQLYERTEGRKLNIITM